MMPRPLLLETFGVSYRKIPILAIGREIYCDTSLIIEALEYYFPSPAYGTVYPQSSPWDYRPLARGFASFWTDKPLFRTTTGLIPHTVWESQFGVDRAQRAAVIARRGWLGIERLQMAGPAAQPAAPPR